MVSDNCRPLWIHRIKQRTSFTAFKRAAKILNEEGANICRVLKGRPKKYVYKVTVETMENCETNPFADMWVPDQLAEASAEMLEDFELQMTPESLACHDDDREPLSEEDCDEYEAICEAEPFDPYARTPEDDEEDDELDDLEETSKGCVVEKK
ncbi:unnamed protein product [Caenorhabditis sp. 36 PRJEB53466]|nr:unnamed protein product [Caenorhabditis sp. 36 PRJEB53466]